MQCHSLAFIAVGTIAFIACGDDAAPSSDTETRADGVTDVADVSPEVGPDLDTRDTALPGDTALLEDSGDDVGEVADANLPDTEDGVAPGDIIFVDGSADVSDGEDAAPPDTWPLDPSQAWGPPGTPLPTGALIVSPEELAASLASGDARIITFAERQSAMAAVESQRIADEALVRAELGDDPRFEIWLPPDTEPLPEGVSQLGDGSFLIDLDDTSVVVDGHEQTIAALATSLRNTTSRPNLEGRFRSLIGRLADDQKEDLADPAALVDLDDAELAEQVAILEERVATHLANRPPLGESEMGDDAVADCSISENTHVSDTTTWQLRAHETAIRSQGLRGSCTAFAIVGGLEAWVKRFRGVDSDLSEQELYAEAKGIWYPTPDYYGDGLGFGALDRMKEHQFLLDAERRWPYNASRKRIEDPETRTYEDSCVDYTSMCSDTNHQALATCATPGEKVYCTVQRPSAVLGDNVGNVGLIAHQSLWDPASPTGSFNAIRAALNAGMPVVVSASIDLAFKGAGLDTRPMPGVLASAGGDEIVGSHSMLAVGYLADHEMPDLHDMHGPISKEVGGWLVLRNSWGCAGDRGHWYVSAGWAASHLTAAMSINIVSTAIELPAVSLTADKSLVTAASPSIELRYDPNLATTRVTLELLGKGTIYSKDGPFPVLGLSYDYELHEEDNGLRFFVAHAEDVFGNVTHSLLLGVVVDVDETAPTVTLTASPSSIVGQGRVSLSATATDPSGIAAVRFYVGNSHLIGTSTVPPYAASYLLSPNAPGAYGFFAIAEDTAGNFRLSNIAKVLVYPEPTPKVISFTSQPQTLPIGGGNAVLSWQVYGATSVRIDQGVGTVPWSGTKEVMVTQPTTFTLTATNLHGTTLATTRVEIAPGPPLINTFTATPSAFGPAGGDTTLAWSVTGPLTALSIDQRIGSVLNSATPNKKVRVSATTTFTLTATNTFGTSTREVTVTVGPDNVLPTVSLSVAPSMTVTAPASIVLTASATDNVGVVKVELRRDGVLFATDTDGTDGWRFDDSFDADDADTYVYGARAYDAAGNAQPSIDRLVTVKPPPPVVTSFTATPTSLPIGGGTTTLAWTLAGGFAYVSIDQGVGSVNGLSQKVVSLTATKTFKLTATNSSGSSVSQVTVTVLTDTTPPTVSLQTTTPQVTVPGTAKLTASASDDVGVTTIDLHRDGQLVASDTTPGDGWVFDLALGDADVGTHTFVATAHDGAGNSQASNGVDVEVVAAPPPPPPPPPPAPTISAFTATPDTVAASGGNTLLAWTVSGTIDSLSIDHGVGSVAGLSQKNVAVTATTTYTLSAANTGGTTTKSVTVTRLADVTDPTVSLAADDDSVVAPATVTFTASASDDVGVVAVELYQDAVLVATDTDGGDGWVFAVELDDGDIGTSSFTAVAEDAAGNSKTSAAIEIEVQAPPTAPTISSFTATPDTVAASGGDIILAWTVSGTVDSLSIDQGIGDVTGLTQETVTVMSTTTYTLSATNAVGTTTKSVTVTRLADVTDPTVSLAADETSVVAPATVTFTASASDDVGVVAVALYQGAVLVATDTDGGDGWVFAVELDYADIGTSSFTALAEDAAGNTKTSAAIEVEVQAPPTAPAISSFTATPDTVAASGGDTLLAWTVSGTVESLSIDHGVGDVTGLTQETVTVTATTTYTLSATNAVGTTTKSVTVTRLADVTDPTVSLAADETSVVAPATVTFTASAGDDVGVVAVDLYEDAVLIGTDTIAGDGWVFEVALGGDDIGTPSFVAVARDAVGNEGTSAAVEVVVDAPPAPEITSFTATPSGLPYGGGATTLAWTVGGAVASLSIDHGVGDVTGLTDKQVTVTTTTLFTLTATNLGGEDTWEVQVVVAADETPPTVSLAASASTIEAPDTLTLTATASDPESGVDYVEFFEDGASLGSDLDGSDGWTLTRDFAAEEAGVFEYHAVAWDEAGQDATSEVIEVEVFAADLRVWVSPTGTDDGVCDVAAPCKKIVHAATVAAGARKVVLADGNYDKVNQGLGVSDKVVVPAGTMIEGESLGLARVGVPISFSGGSIEGVVIDRTIPDFAENAGIFATGGSLLIEGVAFAGSFDGAGTSEGIKVTGSAQVTMRPGAVSDYTAATIELGAASSTTPFIQLLDSAVMTIEGGTFGGPGLGADPTSANNGAGAALLVADFAKLTLSGVTLKFKAIAAAVLNDGELHLQSTTVQAAIAATNTHGIHLESQNALAGDDMRPKLFMTDSTLDIAGLGDTNGIRVWESADHVEVTLTNSVIEGASRMGIVASGELTLLATDSQIRDNAYGGIKCESACSLDFDGGSLSGNATHSALRTAFGALWLGATKTYQLTMRGVTVTGNRSATSNANTNTANNSGLYLKGDANSTFDLGALGDPGGNTFADNVTGNQTSNVWLGLSSGAIIVHAVGNTWTASTQGADAAGHYSTALCGGSSPCDIGAGADGDNYQVTAGTLRLAE